MNSAPTPQFFRRAFRRERSSLGVNVLNNSADSLSVADINQDGFQDVFTGGNVVYGNGDGTFRAPVIVSPTAASNGQPIADFNGDGVPDIIFHDYGTITFFLQDVLTSSSGGTSVPIISHIDLTTVTTARAALDDRSALLDGLGTVLGAIGAHQSRLGFVVTRLQNSSLEYAAARHRIIDADFASETAELIAQNVRREVGSAILAQANSQAKLVLKLLGG